MRQSLLAVAVLTAVLAGCHREAPTAPGTTQDGAAAVAATQADAAFTELSRRYLDEAMRLSPISATQIGDHRFDAEVDDLSEAGRQASLDFNRRYLCLLYTSPSPRDRTRSRMPSSA